MASMCSLWASETSELAFQHRWGRTHKNTLILKVGWYTLERRNVQASTLSNTHQLWGSICNFSLACGNILRLWAEWIQSSQPSALLGGGICVKGADFWNSHCDEHHSGLLLGYLGQLTAPFWASVPVLSFFRQDNKPGPTHPRDVVKLKCCCCQWY